MSYEEEKGTSTRIKLTAHPCLAFPLHIRRGLSVLQDNLRFWVKGSLQPLPACEPGSTLVTVGTMQRDGGRHWSGGLLLSQAATLLLRIINAVVWWLSLTTDGEKDRLNLEADAEQVSGVETSLNYPGPCKSHHCPRTARQLIAITTLVYP
jgi:hypothetical protein